MERVHREGLSLLAALAVIGAAVSLLFAPFTDWISPEEVHEVLSPTPPDQAALYFPPEPQDAPEPLRDLVLRGWELINPHPTNRSFVAMSDLNCSSCHFEGGLTAGGKNGGISLVGAAAGYPQPRASGQVFTLADRVNQCLRVNLNGQTLVTDSVEMEAMCAYLHWISKGVPIYNQPPWLGLEPLRPAKDPPGKAEAPQVFHNSCAVCHGADGRGTQLAPPLWGPQSFTHASAMGNLPLLATFVHRNMPRWNPALDPGNALAAARYVLAQPRPDPTKE